mmetsp:Transcript_29152/g.84752  ORF Transcript_29152/g.84752 Transcript_29152/m.84752 type:complete len:232 (+) Transcript_29152:881-1576(+)
MSSSNHNIYVSITLHACTGIYSLLQKNTTFFHRGRPLPSPPPAALFRAAMLRSSSSRAMSSGAATATVISTSLTSISSPPASATMVTSNSANSSASRCCIISRSAAPRASSASARRLTSVASARPTACMEYHHTPVTKATRKVAVPKLRICCSGVRALMASVPAMRVSGDAMMRSWASWWASWGGSCLWAGASLGVAAFWFGEEAPRWALLLPGRLVPFRGRRGLRVAVVV